MQTISPANLLLSEDIIHNMVVSYHGGDRRVHAICHHSGRYLTRSEYVQGMALMPLHEQHDFPGLPELDERFRSAAHDVEFKHLMWSKIGVSGVGMLISAALLLACVVLLFSRVDFLSGWVETIIALVVMMAGVIAALVLAFRGVERLAKRTQLFHEWSRSSGQPPSTPDFPVLDCRYQLDAREDYSLKLTNDAISTDRLVALSEGKLAVTVDPHKRVADLFSRYRDVYRASGAVPTFAGVIALDELNNVSFIETPTRLGSIVSGLDQSHRVMLRSTAQASSDIQSLHHSFEYQVNREVLFSPVEPAAASSSFPQLFDAEDDRSKLVIECIPELDPHDSRQLHLTFRWLGRKEINWVLEECHIGIPPELGDALLVDRGRIDRTRSGNFALWRNLPLRRDPPESEHAKLTLSVRFAEPILRDTPEFHGTFHMRANELVSGLNIHGSRIWDAMGLPADSDQKSDITINRASYVNGEIRLTTTQLTHQHEMVENCHLRARRRADHALIGSIVKTLVRAGVQVQRAEQSRPHSDLSDEGNIQVAYWDITGRSYRPGRLDPIDLHAVVAGRYLTADLSEPADQVNQSSTVELRLRCLHDPRNKSTVKNEVERKMKELASALQKEVPGLMAEPD